MNVTGLLYGKVDFLNGCDDAYPSRHVRQSFWGFAPSYRPVGAGAVIRASMILLLCLLFPFRAGAASGEGDAKTWLTEANQAFHEANSLAVKDPDAAADLYRRAIMRYQRIIRDGGIQNGKLYYNIGNAYFRMKDLGRAILNYRRAAEFIPHDSNLQQNLAYARSRCRDQIEIPEKQKILKTLFFWHYDLTFRMRRLLFGVFFVTFWLFAGGRLLVRRSSLTWAVGITGLLSLMFLASTLVEAMHRRTENPAVIIAEEVTARKGDSESYEQSFKEPLHAGTECSVLEKRGRWVHVSLMDARRCWLPANSVEEVVQRFTRRD